MPQEFDPSDAEAGGMTTTTPRHAIATLADNPRIADGDDERFTGYGAMGVPFSSGHYLAFRDMLATSVGPPYRAVWHRDPQARWTLFTTVAPEVSCPRYFGAGSAYEQAPTIDAAWPEDGILEVTMGERLSWRLELASTPATRMMTGMGRALPASAWDSIVMLGAMGPMAGGALGSGRIRLRGDTPNGQLFKAAPLQVWRVVGGQARLDGMDLGSLAPLPEQTRLADFWLPQRGLFFAGRINFVVESAQSPHGDTGAHERRDAAAQG
jgi:hypothetical protein